MKKTPVEQVLGNSNSMITSAAMKISPIQQLLLTAAEPGHQPHQHIVPSPANKSFVLRRMNKLGKKADKFANGVREHVRLGPKITEIVKGNERSIKFSSPNGQFLRMHYKVLIPLEKIKGVNQSENVKNPSQKYIEMIRELVIKEGSWLEGQKNEGVLKSSFVPEISGGPKEGVGPSAGSIIMEVEGKASEEGEKRDKGEEKVNISLRQGNRVESGFGGVYSKELHGLHGNLSGDEVWGTQEDTLVAGSKMEMGGFNRVGSTSRVNDRLVKGEKKGASG
ncbi:hypothetical protein Q3G72_000951 [Acer saccharum]|nr:hypothetical protein Q3G72_000951 [Acer saccharum]